VFKTFKKGGIHPAENKITVGKGIVDLPLSEVVTIPVTQHIGARSKIVVEQGEQLRVGQVLAEGEGFVSSNIHSSVSGKVSKIDKFTDASGYKRMAIQIEVEGDEWIESIDRSETLKTECNLEQQDIIKKVHESGIVGMGGATFPTHVKLTLPRGERAEHLIVNGVECEPYLTSDHALMLEKGAENG